MYNTEMESLGKTLNILSYEKGERGHIKREHNQVAFNIEIASKNYILLGQNEKEYEYLRNDRRYFEITADDRAVNMYFDYDNKKPSVRNPLLAYGEITEHIDYMTDYLRLHNIVKNPKFYVLISIEPKERDIRHDINDKWIKSLHIITNIALPTKKHIQQLANDLHSGTTKINEYYDNSIYDTNRLFRAVYQSKGGDRKDIFIPFTSNGTECYEYKGTEIIKGLISHNLCNYVISHTEHSENAEYEITEDTIENEPTAQQYNIEYILSSQKCKGLELWISKQKTATNGQEWFKRVNTLLGIIKWLEITNDKKNELIEKFLDIPRSRNDKTNKDYTTQECKNNDMKIIEDIDRNGYKGIKNSEKTLFTEIPNKEVKYIYEKLELQHTAKTIWKLISIERVEHLQLEDNENVFYNMKTKVLIKNGSIITEKKRKLDGEIELDKNGKPKLIKVLKKQTTEDEYNYNIDDIQQRIPKIVAEEEQALTNIHNISINNIQSWTEIQANSNNEYNCGAVGSRKTSLRMDADIKYALQQPNSIILMPRDSIVMCNKTYEECCEKYGEEMVYHYDIESSKENIENKRIIITTIHSLLKLKELQQFTHTYIDEIKNVLAKFKDIKTKYRDDTYDYFTELHKRTIVKYYDADKDIFTIKQLGLFNGTFKPLIINNLINYKQTNHIIEVKCEKNGLTEIISLLKNNHKITISCSYNLTALKLHTLITEMTGKHGAILCGKGKSKGSIHENNNITGDDFKTNMSSKTNEEWSEYDFVIWTSTITTGISYDNQDTFYKHFSLEGSEGENATQSAQMIFRTRKLISKTICIIPISNNMSLLNDCKTTGNVNIDYHNNTEHAKHNFNNHIKGNKDYTTQYNPNLHAKFIQKKEDTYTKKKTEILEKFNKNILGIEAKMKLVSDFIEEQSNKKKIRMVIEKCILWGCDTIISNTYDLITAEEMEYTEMVESEIEAKSWLDMDRNEWLDTDFISRNTIEEYKNKVVFTEQERKEKSKYYELLKYGYSHTIYEKIKENDLLKELYDNHITTLDTNIQDAQNTYNKAKYLMLYKVKKYYDFIFKTGFNNTETAKDTDFLKYRKQSYYFYVVFNVLEICNITYEDIAEFLQDTTKEIYIEKTAENYKKLVDLYEYVKPTIEYLKANDKSNDTLRSKLDNIADFKKITILLEKPFFHFGMKIQMGRQIPRTKREKNINIFMNGETIDNVFYQYSYRVQEKAYRFNSNESDDIARLEEDENYGLDKRLKIRLCNYNLWEETHKEFYNFITNGENYKQVFTDIHAEIKKGEIDNDYELIEEEDTEQDTDLYGEYDY
jgi:hypothetical protein